MSAEVVHQLTERTARLRRVDDFLGGADTYGMYVAELDSTVRLLRDGSYAEATGRKLLALLAEQAQMAGWAAFDAGRHDDAGRHYRTSLDAARDADDAPLAGNALAFLAYQDVSLGRDATEQAIAACETAGRGATPRVRALLNFRRAWVHAVNGQAGAAQQHLTIGSESLTEQDERPEPDWVYWIDDREAQIMAGRCWTVLRRPLRAIPLLEDVLVRYDDTHARDKALYLSWLADAYLDANEIEQACTTVARVIRLSADVGSIRPAQRVKAFASRLDPYATLPWVADVREQVRIRSHRRPPRATIPDRI